MNITDEEIASLKAVTSSDEWNDACTVIKATRDGAFPSDWWPKVIQSGLANNIFTSFGGNPEITIT